MIDFYLNNEYWFASLQLVLAMIGMGATLSPRDFREVLVEPKAVSIGLVLQLVLVPLVAFVFIRSFELPPGIAIGFALIAVVPGGTLSNVFTHLAGGNTPLSISVTATSNLACLVTIPLMLDVLILEHMPAGFELPAATIATEIAVFLFVPLAIGMLCRRYMPDRAQQIEKYCIRGSMLVVILIVMGAAGADRLDMKAFSGESLVGFALFAVVLALVAGIVPRFFGLTRPDIAAIEMEVLIRNVNLGLLIKASLFPTVIGKEDATGNLVLFTLLLYGVVQLLMAVVLVSMGRSRIKRLAFR